jgi:thiol-disulfide isomerase/thioredoxin
MKQVWEWVKPLATILIVVVLLKVTGLFAPVVGFGQSAIMLTGLFNASADTEAAAERFDYGFTLQDLDGQRVDFAQFKGKVVFLNLWATWCPPCRAEMPSIEALYQRTKSNDQIVFVMLSVDDDDKKEKVQNYITGKAHTFPVFMPSGYLPEQLQVPSIPTTFVISKDGKVVKQEVGMRNYNTDKFEKFLNGLAAE